MRSSAINTKATLFLAIVFLAINLGNALPLPQSENDGQELLAGRDTRYYGYPFFWFGIPFYEDDENIGYGGQNADTGKRSSTMSYAHVGAGWGR